jgi:hypothetical protein
MNPRRGIYGLAVLISAVALASCGGNGSSLPPPSQPANSPLAPTLDEPVTPGVDTAYPVEMGTPEPLPSPYPYPIASEAPPAADGQPMDAALIELAKKDLAQQLSVAADQITVVSSVYMDWPDSSLGCPQPGFAYSQVITPGYRIVLEQAQKQYDYHTNLVKAVVLCTP